MRASASLPLLLSACCVFAACTPRDAAPDTAPAVAPGSGTDAAAPPPVAGPSAMAILMPTAGNGVTGTLNFAPAADGVHVTGTIGGLGEDGVHGFHVHEFGDCSAPDGGSAGGHFNPAGRAHGRVGSAEHHAGDTDNLVADAQGVAQADHHLSGVSLGDGAPTDIVGKAVIVHAGSDDYSSQPTGDAGARLACGVIEATP